MHTKKEPNLEETIAIQSWLSPALTPVGPNTDYHAFAADIKHIDTILSNSIIERMAIDFALEDMTDASAGQRARKAEFALFALRSELLRHLLRIPSYRIFSRELASSDLLSQFCNIRSLTGIKWTSKSTLDRASKFFNEHQIRKINEMLLRLSSNDQCSETLGINTPIDSSISLVDTTCLEANIHFPVDWLLLKDVSLTLLKSIALVRKEKLLNRMPCSVEEFACQMNRLCIRMTNARRKQGSKKLRKQVLREMKTLLKNIDKHARIHRDMLEEKWANTPLSEVQSQQILERMNKMIEQVPVVIKQAHERIIGGRPIESSKKTLSAYEKDIDVITRGKSSAEVEFGNSLFLAESPEGFITDYELHGRGAPSDYEQLESSIQRQLSFGLENPLNEVVADRGFDVKGISNLLEDLEIENHICPRNVQKLHERMKEPLFKNRQRRRAGTEARIAILKNNGGGRVCRSKGLSNRQLAVGWGVLAHNTWWIARTARAQSPPLEQAA